MSAARLIPLAFVPPMLIALLFMLKLAAALFLQALATGLAEALLVAWVFAFVVGLPGGLVLLSLAGALRSHKKRSATIPFVGVKIPEMGQ